jgi:hypothetical protein
MTASRRQPSLSYLPGHVPGFSLNAPRGLFFVRPAARKRNKPDNLNHY